MRQNPKLTRSRATRNAHNHSRRNRSREARSLKLLTAAVKARGQHEPDLARGRCCTPLDARDLQQAAEACVSVSSQVRKPDLGQRSTSAGRMGSPDDALAVFLEPDPAAAIEKVNRLDVSPS
jgi:hypothetical protein